MVYGRVEVRVVADGGGQVRRGVGHLDDGLRHCPEGRIGVVGREKLLQRLPRLCPVPVGQAHERVQRGFGKHILKERTLRQVSLPTEPLCSGRPGYPS